MRKTVRKTYAWVITALVLSSDIICSAYDKAAVSTWLRKKVREETFERWKDGVVLYQHVDRLNSRTTYSYDRDHVTGHVEYSRESDDRNESIIVLEDGEDNLPISKAFKRVHIVLRRDSELKFIYYPTTLLLRDAGPKDVGLDSIEADGQRMVAEATTITHDLALRMMVCSTSFLAPCDSTPDPSASQALDETEPAANATEPDNELVGAPWQQDGKAHATINMDLESVKWATADGSSADRNYDLYLDLEVAKAEGRGMILTALASVSSKVANIRNGAHAVFKFQILNFKFQAGPDPGESPLQPIANQASGFGWKTKDAYPVKNSYINQDRGRSYFAFGVCALEPADPRTVTSTGRESAIEFYVKLLRIQCSEGSRHVLKLLLDNKLVSHKGGLEFDIVAEHKAWSTFKLPLKELILISPALQLVSFSRIFIAHHNVALHLDKSGSLPKPSLSPSGHVISYSVHMFVQTALEYLALARDVGRGHAIHLTRAMLLQTEDIMNKLEDDGTSLHRNCMPSCKADADQNYNDRVYTMGLAQFIRHGLNPVDRGVAYAQTAFAKFYADNEANLAGFLSV